jgi:hypothetical protein
MPNRLREKYLRDALEAIVCYAEEGDVLHYHTEPGELGPLRITFELEDVGALPVHPEPRHGRENVRALQTRRSSASSPASARWPPCRPPLAAM